MAEIRPFRALHYNQGCISALDKVITQPYDKISPEMQARYYELSPHNLVRIIRGRQAAADAAQESLYTRAQLDFLDARGCPFFQGFYVSPALAPDAFVQFARKRKRKPSAAHPA